MKATLLIGTLIGLAISVHSQNDPEVKWLNEQHKALLFKQSDLTELRMMDRRQEKEDAISEKEERAAARQYLKDLQKITNTDGVLETSRSRDKKLAALEALKPRFTKAVLRIMFSSEGLILQGTFDVNNTIADVEKFVAGFLERRKQKFELYMAPPKRVLSPEKTLKELRLYPAANVFFGSESKGRALKAELDDKITSAKAMNDATTKLRDQMNADANAHLATTMRTPPSSTVSTATGTDAPSGKKKLTREEREKIMLAKMMGKKIVGRK